MCANLLQSCLTLCAPMNSPGSSVRRDSPCKNTRVDYHALLQGIFPIQGLNSHLLYLISPPLAGGFFTTSVTWETSLCFEC